MRSDAKLSKCVGHTEEKEKKEAKAIRPCGELKQKQRAETESNLANFCVSSKESKTQKRESFNWRCSLKK